MNGKTEMVDKYEGQTILALGAHPDDLELGIGGTIAQLTRSGARVIMAIASVPNHYEKRKDETERAAALLGAEALFLFPEGGPHRVEDLKTYQLVDRIDELVTRLKPAAILSHGGTNFHRDHVLMHNACLAAQRLNYFDFFCFNPTSTRPVPMPFFPQVYVDISDTVDLKMRSIRMHATQFGDRGLDADHLLDVARHFGRLAGVEFAEGLEVVRLKLN
jgi:LmbE family N-acetylglucosaminyl deacetylase